MLYQYPCYFKYKPLQIYQGHVPHDFSYTCQRHCFHARTLKKIHELYEISKMVFLNYLSNFEKKISAGKILNDTPLIKP